jgi:ribonucleoside-diphosphate reductase alpha chain
VKDYGWDTWGVRGKLATQCTAEEHLGVLIACTKWVDSAVSKTCNVSPDMPWDSFKQIYMTAWQHGCKGITTFNPGGKRYGILETPTIDQIQEEDGGACYFDPETGQKECS